MLNLLWQGFEIVARWENIVAIVLGVTSGQLIGAVPGFTSTMAIALLVPVTFYIHPITGITFLLGIYKGAMYGGSIPAILVNAPGTPAASATILDGHPMAKKGQADKALKMALYASVIGDTLSDLVLICVAGFIASLAMRFGPPEFFSLVLFSLTVVGSIAGKSILKGLLSAGFGVFVATIGLDPLTALPRFTFGVTDLETGFSLIPALIGLFVFSEVLIQTEGKGEETKFSIFQQSTDARDRRISKQEWRRSLPVILQSSAIGTFIGAIPGLGPTVSAFLSYGQAQRMSKHPEKFGTGVVEGVAAAEAGNSSTCGATLIPLLTLGIPGDIATAVLIGAFMLQGLKPGPMLFREHAVIVYGIFAGMILCNIANLLIGQFSMRLYARIVTAVPKRFLFPVVWVLCIIGSYAVNSIMFDVYSMLLFGIVGYVLRKLEIPPMPLLLGFILSPMLEMALRQSMIISDGDVMIFIHRPISLAFITLTIAMIGYLIFIRLRERQRMDMTS
jgi:putative tricarboxylic transport membrane protein